MKDFNALKDIWSGQSKETLLNFDDLIRAIKKSKHGFGSKLIKETAGMAAVLAFFSAIWYYGQSSMWTTHLAFLIIISTSLYYLIIQFIDYKTISRSDQLLKKPHAYILHLKNYKQRRYIFNTRKYYIYSVFVGIALLLYFIELYFYSSIWHILIGVLFTAGWFYLCWYLMKIYIQREQDELTEMIDKLERLESQFS